MNIINVLQSQLKSSLDKATFEINSALSDSNSEGAVDRLAKAIRNYTNLMNQVEVLLKLREQVEKQEQEQEAEAQKAKECCK
jgi:hypothetical protein